MKRRALALASRYRRVFPLAYEEDVDPADALEDLADLEALRTDSSRAAAEPVSPAPAALGSACT